MTESDSRTISRDPQFRFILRGLMRFVFYCSLVLGVFCLLLPAISHPPELGRRSQCTNNLKMIGLALHQYHDDYGCFPPPAIRGANGKPMHSWRVMLTPYVEDFMGAGFVQQYDLSQPWDSPANMKAARPINRYSKPYVCPSAGQPPDAAFTNYVMIVGSETACRPSEYTSLDQISDGPARTILVAEIADSDIFWTEPRDLSFEEMSFRLNDKLKPSVSSRHTHRGDHLAAVLFADGTVKFLDDSTKPEELQTMLTSSAGD